MCFEDRTHQNRGAASPDAGFDQVSRDFRLEHAFHERLHIVQPLPSYHGQSLPRGPFQTFYKVRSGFVNGIEDDFLNEIEVEPASFNVS